MKFIPSRRSIQKIKSYALAHKIASALLLVLILGAGYWAYTSYGTTSDETRYVMATVQKGTLIVSISGSGQVSASNQVDVKSKASGDIVGVYMTQGKEVAQGTLWATIDPSDANRAVREAETSLETAKLELDKLLEPLDELTLLQAENSLTQAKETKQNAQDDLEKAYENGFNTIANAFLDLPALMTGLQDMLFTSTAGLGLTGQWNIDYYENAISRYDTKSSIYKTDTANKYSAARSAYDKNFQDYKSTNRSSDTDTIELLIDETYETTRSIAEAVKSTNNLIQLYEDELVEHNLTPSSVANTHLTSLNTYTGKTNTSLLNLLNAKNTIKNDKDAIVSAERSIEEKELSLTKIKKGPDDLDIRAKKIAIQQKEDALLTAKETLSNYYIRAPFDGVVAKISAKKGDSASASTIIATIITKQRIAEISLNEVEVAKVKVGQKVTLTFDAVEGLSISGEVAEIDTIGTVTQGVVTYSVKIGFDTQDDRVKSGMSTSAAIITSVKQDVLMAPNSAVKSQGTTYYVEIFDTALPPPAAGTQGSASSVSPRQQQVETGISNDTSTEIISGLREGDQIVTRTITANSTTQTTQQAPSNLC